MSDNPSKLTVGLLEEANFPTWRPVMEARLRQLGVFRIVTGERTEPEEPNYVVPTPAGGTAAAPVAAVALTREERALNAQLKSAYKRELNEFKDSQEKAAGDILAHLPPLSLRPPPRHTSCLAWCLRNPKPSGVYSPTSTVSSPTQRTETSTKPTLASLLTIRMSPGTLPRRSLQPRQTEVRTLSESLPKALADIKTYVAVAAQVGAKHTGHSSVSSPPSRPPARTPVPTRPARERPAALPEVLISMAAFEPSWKHTFVADTFVRTLNTFLGAWDDSRGIRVVAARVTRGDQIAITGAPGVSLIAMSRLVAPVPWGKIVGQALGAVDPDALALRAKISDKWSKVRISGVPTGKSGSRDAFSPTELLASMREATPFTRDLLVRQEPRWIRPPELYGPGEVSSFSFAFKDPDGELLKKLCRAPVFVTGVKARASQWKEKASASGPGPASSIATSPESDRASPATRSISAATSTTASGTVGLWPTHAAAGPHHPVPTQAGRGGQPGRGQEAVKEAACAGARPTRGASTDIGDNRAFLHAHPDSSYPRSGSAWGLTVSFLLFAIRFMAIGRTHHLKWT
jgi:hypothetical protein